MGSIYGYGGYAKIGSSAIMPMPGGTLARPRNIFTPYPIGNRYGLVNYSTGGRFPTVQLPLIVMASWFTAANLNTWGVTRGAAPEYDVAKITGDIEYADTAGNGHKVNDPKLGSFSFGCRWGQNPLVLNTTFMGTKLDTAGVAPAAVTEAPLTFASVSLDGGLASKGVIGFSVQYDNQLTPNEELAGQDYPTEHNADHPVCMLTLTVYAKNGVLPPGYTDPDTYTEVEDAAINVKIADGTPNTYTTFSFSKLLLENPNDRQMVSGRGLRTFRYRAIATDAAYPLVISET